MGSNPTHRNQVVLTCFGFHSLHLCKSLSFGFADFLLKNPFEIYTRVAKWRRHLVHTEAYIGSNPIFGIYFYKEIVICTKVEE